eukprot:CAMPEP_0172698458 /NCGR_PEP_ID=MMETSP1074-20121228/29488_1 /TAXON_ID=2916 /ORGANISM="Ceratium fusus, Strain PA161109" /LENGTH=489 /DNA_ID=CAMNT_0013519505 /DNA_START=58 /DNA_END=1527 /DNA_ORIENTATION=-
MGAAVNNGFSACLAPNLVESPTVEKRDEVMAKPPVQQARPDKSDKRVQAADDIWYGPAGTVKKGATGTVTGIFKGANNGSPHILVKWDALPRLAKVSVRPEQIQFISPECPGPYVIIHEAGVTRGVPLSPEAIAVLSVGTVVEIVEVLHNQGENRWRGRLKEPVRGWVSLLATDNGERWAIQEHLLPTLLPAERAQAAEIDQTSAPRLAAVSNGTAIQAAAIRTGTRQKSLNLINAPSFAHRPDQVKSVHVGSHQKPGVLRSSTSFGLSSSQQGGVCTPTMVRATSFGSPLTVQPPLNPVRTGYSSVSVRYQPGHHVAGVVPARRANSLPPSMPSSVHFSVRDELLTARSNAVERTNSSRVVPPLQWDGEKNSAECHDAFDINRAYPSASSDGAYRQRSTALSVHSSTTCTPSYTARGPLESITRSPSWVAMDSPVDTAPGQPLPPEGPFFSSPQEVLDNGKVLALGAQPQRPHTKESASSDTLPPQSE